MMNKERSAIALRALVAGALVATAASAQAGIDLGGWERMSQIGDAAVDNGDGTHSYTYTVHNTSVPRCESEFCLIDGDGEWVPRGAPIVVDWELPWFGDAGIDTASILSPDGWSWAIETVGVRNSATGWGGVADWQDPSNAFYEGSDSPFTNATEVLHWYSDCAVGGFEGPQVFNAEFEEQEVNSCEWSFQDSIFVGDELSGFGFTAAYEPTGAPYQASWAFEPVRTGDPLFPLSNGIPASPLVTGAAANVPEPGVLALIGLGLLAAGAARRRA